jgi:hypothetical protein
MSATATPIPQPTVISTTRCSAEMKASAWLGEATSRIAAVTGAMRKLGTRAASMPSIPLESRRATIVPRVVDGVTDANTRPSAAPARVPSNRSAAAASEAPILACMITIAVTTAQ